MIDVSQDSSVNQKTKLTLNDSQASTKFEEHDKEASIKLLKEISTSSINSTVIDESSKTEIHNDCENTASSNGASPDELIQQKTGPRQCCAGHKMLLFFCGVILLASVFFGRKN